MHMRADFTFQHFALSQFGFDVASQFISNAREIFNVLKIVNVHYLLFHIIIVIFMNSNNI